MGVFLRKNNWWIDYRVGPRRVRKMIGPNKTLAMNVLRKRKVELAEGKHLDVQKEKRVAFKDFAHVYLENHCKVNNRAWNNADRAYLNPENPGGLVAYFGGKFLHEITPLMIEQYKRERKEVVSVSTVNRTLNILSSLFNRAIDWGMTHENPMRKVKHYRQEHARLRYLEKSEIQNLLSHCSPKLQAIVTLAVNTGMRRGEIENLKWQDIDFQKGVICILEQKNGEKSYIALNEPARTALMRVKKHIESPYVFCKNDGRQYSFRKSFETALTNAKIEDATFHTLRHSFASHLAMAGVDLNTVRELMRHKSLAMTQRYAHLSKDHKSRAVEVLAGQMDTIWTPKPKLVDDKEFAAVVSQMATIGKSTSGN